MQLLEDRSGTDIATYLRVELSQRHDWVLLYADLRYFRAYNQFYGFVAGEHLLEVFQVLLAAQLPDDCHLYRVGGDEFLGFSRVDRAEADASAICDRWQHLLGQFYHPLDIERGFLVGNGRNGIGCRCPLVQVCIGLVSYTHHPHPLKMIPEICSAAVATNALARCQRQSTFVSEDRMQEVLARKQEPSSSRDKALHLWQDTRAPQVKVLAIVPDAALACLLQVRLELEGYEVNLCNSAREAAGSIEAWRPNVAIVDPDPEVATCRYLRSLASESEMLLVALGSDGDRIAVLEAGADLFVPKPFELEDLLYWIERLLQSHLKAVDARLYVARPDSPLSPRTG
ncbi:diguanylate cyclase domain-containing protein [Synechococcus sp. PCC 7336]|uniref:diguanylate cyclase domain-containing protein n=1 Tax=Synechococcus sp. PCC 7336 TaxID=195250 RepID=UPI000348E54F|nr:diguanylate cyclase [Synechococcus sp. PCC 7336]